MKDVPKGKRELILEAAEKVFSEKGFFQAKVEEIAVEAGVGKGTVYEYFSSKEEVFQQMLLEVMEDSNLDRLEVENSATAAEKIEAFLKMNHRFIMKHKNMAKMLMQEHLTMSNEMFEAMKARKEETLQKIEDIVVEGIAAGEFRADIDPKVTAHLIMGATLSLSGDILHGDNPMSTDTLSGLIMEMLLRGIASSPERQ